MSESRTWKSTLGARIPEAWGREIDILVKTGKILLKADPGAL